MFLRNTVMDPLEDKVREMINGEAVIIQKVWKGYLARKREYIRC